MSASVPERAIISGPDVQWDHVDGPLMTWAGQSHWLTAWERVRLFLRLSTIETVAENRFPHIARARRHLLLIALFDRLTTPNRNSRSEG